MHLTGLFVHPVKSPATACVAGYGPDGVGPKTFAIAAGTQLYLAIDRRKSPAAGCKPGS